ncbi:phosphonopyruvate decarboxylase, partial [Candidatus Parvarchaeota archaeon]
MINPKEFYDFLLENEIEFFTGVPDSLLKNFNSVIIDNSPKEKHVISANEGGSIALASGYYLATKKLALVYMQNSGQGNAINPLLSLADKEVYGIPMVILFGWRGEPGKEDEPQHVKQGEVSLKILEALGVPYSILPEKIDSAKQILKKAVDISTSCNMPYVLVVRKNTFEKYISLDKSPNLFQLSREDSLRLIVNNLSERDLIVSTTGKLSRELFELREELGQNHGNDFLTVGSMGHS